MNQAPEAPNEEIVEENPDEGHTMGVLDHLEELRWAILKSLSGFFFGVLLTAVFFNSFFDALKYPLDRALSEESPELVALTSTSVTGVFIVMIQVCLIGGVGFGLPFTLYHFARFVAPGLTAKEKRVLAPACLCSLILFLSGCVFSYFVIIPVGLEMILLFNKMLGLAVIWTAQSYYNLVIWLMIGVGLAFEFPLIMIVLQYVGIIHPQQLREYRRVAVVLLLVAAALITPGGDPITFMILGGVLYLFYEAAIVVGTRLVKQRELARDLDYDEEE